MRREVLVTGLGVVSPLGCGAAVYWRGLLEDDSRPIEHPDIRPEHMRHRRVYVVRDWTPEAALASPFGERPCQLALSAARLALEDARLGPADTDPGGGVCLGSAAGSQGFERERAGGPPVSALDTFGFDAAAAVGTRFGLHGPNLTVATACAAGVYSVGLAADLVRSGACEMMLAGGTEVVSRVTLACFNRLAAVDPEVCRSFDARRQGTVPGEGAAVLVLESRPHARARGAVRAYATVEGAGWSSDAFHATIPEPSGGQAAQAVRRALQDAQLDDSAIDCVLASGTGTRHNDAAESRALEAVFGTRLGQVWVTAVKPKLGHSGGAAGAFSCLTAALMLRHGCVPPVAHLRDVDPDCPLRLPREPARATLRHVLVIANAFGGTNIGLVMGSHAHD